MTKETKEPYRMMTSRAEYRLLLRQDNADLRLTDIGHEIGLIDDKRYAAFCEKRRLIESEISRLKETMIGAGRETQEFLAKYESAPIHTAVSLADIIRRPEFSYEKITEIDNERPVELRLSEALANELNSDLPEPSFIREVIEQINISIKYEGYIERQKKQVEHFLRMEEKKIPEDIDYSKVKNLRIEARQKLEAVRPRSIGQASRISGVSPADVTMIMLYLNI